MAPCAKSIVIFRNALVFLGVSFFVLLLSCERAAPPAPAANVAERAARAPRAPIAGLLPFDQAKLKSEGAIDPQVFARVMGKRQSSFKVCYKKALADDPAATGEVRVRFGISPTGRVSTVEVLDSTLKHPETEHCLIRVIRRIQFPASGSGQWVRVEYPLIFVP